MSKHPKVSGNRSHPNPNNNGAGEQRRSISGDVHVRGEVFFEPGPNEVLARKSAEQEERAKYREKKWIERATLFVVTIYAGLTAWQGFTTQRIASLTRDQFTKDQRPYVWIFNIGIDPIEIGKPITASVVFRNVGKSPVLRVWDVSFVTSGPSAEQQMDYLFEVFQRGQIQLDKKSTAFVLLPEIQNDPATHFFSRPASGYNVNGELNDWLTQHDTIMVAGRIFYQDIAGNTYHSDYCVIEGRLSGFKGAANCAKHNEIK